MYQTQLKGLLQEEVGCLNQIHYLSIQINGADSGKLAGPLLYFSDLEKNSCRAALEEWNHHQYRHPLSSTLGESFKCQPCVVL